MLVVGADGNIGRALAAACERRGDRVHATTRHADRVGAGRPLLDLGDLGEAELPAADVAFICAAFTGYAPCRERPETAHRVNVAAVAELARRFRAAGTRTVHLSSSSVLDGTRPLVAADTPRHPLSAYGRSKAGGEEGIGADQVLARLTKVVPPDFPLLAGWCGALLDGRPVDAFADMTMAPVTMEHAVASLLAIADDDATGIFQISADRDISYLEAGRRLAERLGVSTALVRAASAAERGIPPAERPAFTSMDTGRLAALIGRPPPAAFEPVDAVAAAWLAGRAVSA